MSGEQLPLELHKVQTHLEIGRMSPVVSTIHAEDGGAVDIAGTDKAGCGH